ncbi:hypothetical protein MMC15_000814 [Xylographa vitiligo]|nr:hypothetical protein [Xylographa vitiligo]
MERMSKWEVMLIFLTNILLEDVNLKNTLELHNGKLSHRKTIDKDRSNRDYAAFLFRESSLLLESLVGRAWRGDLPEWVQQEKPKYKENPTSWSETLDHQLQNLPYKLKAKPDDLEAKPENATPGSKDLPQKPDDLQPKPDALKANCRRSLQKTTSSKHRIVLQRLSQKRYESLRKYLRHEPMHLTLLSETSKHAPHWSIKRSQESR